MWNSVWFNKLMRNAVYLSLDRESALMFIIAGQAKLVNEMEKQLTEAAFNRPNVIVIKEQPKPLPH
jgi:hypothetical protein